MRLLKLPVGAMIALAMASVAGSVSLAAQSPSSSKAVNVAATKPAPPASTFATLKSVSAAPMSSSELQAVKGLHVHFLDAGGTGIVHLAGDVKTENNWENLGGSDGMPVAPSYKGLCVAAGYSGPSAGAIAIPGGQFQCPL
jgi:hypothetical protein